LLRAIVYANERLGTNIQADVLSRDPEAFKLREPTIASHSRLRFVRGQITDSRLEGAYDGVVHAATEASASLNDTRPDVMLQTIVDGTRNLIGTIIESSGAIPVLFTSSGAVYGPQPPEMTHLPETYPGAPDCTRPASAYAEGKRAAELLCACYHARHPALEPLIARCFAFIGPILPLDAHFAAGNFIRDALRGGPIRIAGDGAPFRSYLYAADLAVWLWHLLFRGEPGVACNVGSDAALDIESLARLVARHARPPCEVTIAGSRDPALPPPRYVPDVTRITRALDLPPFIGLEEAVSRTLAFYGSTE